MTTIAFKSGVLVFDSLVTQEDSYLGSMIKGIKTKKYLAAAAGNAEDVAAFLRWVETDLDMDKKPDSVECDINAILINKKNDIILFDSGLSPYHIKTKFFALGSGGHFAMGAMAHGATALEAVKVARKLDTKTGGRIRKLSLK